MSTVATPQAYTFAFNIHVIMIKCIDAFNSLFCLQDGTCKLFALLKRSVKRTYFQFSKLHVIQARSHSGYFKCIFMCRVCQTTSAGCMIARIQIIQAVNLLLIVLFHLLIFLTILSHSVFLLFLLLLHVIESLVLPVPASLINPYLS